MSSYLGIDVGTTNTKILALHGDGSSEVLHSNPTATYTRDGVAYFDMRAIEADLSKAVDSARRNLDIRGVGFSSVGESVVPIDEKGRTLSDPVVWYDRVTVKLFRELGNADTLFPYEERGLQAKHTLGVYKMLWMKRNLPEVAAVRHWLPVSSYIPFRWSGEMRWDFSQACRSHLVNIHDRRWDTDTMGELGLAGELPPVDYMGSRIGTTAEGLPLYLGGHDHIVGMNGVRILFGSDTIFDSIGSASVLGGTVSVSAEEMRKTLAAADDLIVGVAHAPGSYYVENSTRYFGKLLEAVARLLGAEDVALFYDEMNSSLERRESTPEALPLFFVEGDRIVRQDKSGYDIRDLDVNAPRESVVWGLYLYLAVTTQLIVEELGDMFDTPRFVAGGGTSRNSLLMQVTADVLNRPITLLNQSELSGLGAALTAAESAGDTETIGHTRDRLETRTLEPSDTREGRAAAAAELRRTLVARWRGDE
jgi:sugar (pentulose or hexulose) kinase